MSALSVSNDLNNVLIVLLVMLGILSAVNYWLRQWLKKH